MTKVGVYNEDGEPLGIEYVYDDEPYEYDDDGASVPDGYDEAYDLGYTDGCDGQLSQAHQWDDDGLRDAYQEGWVDGNSHFEAMMEGDFIDPDEGRYDSDDGVSDV